MFDTVTGNYIFSSDDIQKFPPGTYTFKITGTSGDFSTSKTFTITLVDPCPDSVLTLLDSPFTDQVVWRREDYSQPWNVKNLVTHSIGDLCGTIEIEFFYSDENRTPLDDSIFRDDRESETDNEFTVLKAVNGDLKEGSYSILYRAYLANYQQVEVVQTMPFIIDVVDPCPIMTLSLQPSPFTDQEAWRREDISQSWSIASIVT